MLRCVFLLFSVSLLGITFLSCKTQQASVTGVASEQAAPQEDRVNVSPEAKKLLADLQQEDLTQHPFKPSSNLINKYALERSGDTYYIRGLMKVTREFDDASLVHLGVMMSPPAGDIVPVVCPVHQLPTLLQQKGITYFDFGGAANPALDK